MLRQGEIEPKSHATINFSAVGKCMKRRSYGVKKACVYAGISILLWSTIATVSKLLLNTLNSYQVLTFSSFFAGASLPVTVILNGKIKQFKDFARTKITSQ